MKTIDEFEQDLEKERELSNTKTERGHLEYANDLVSNNSLVQLIGAHVFYLKTDFETALRNNGYYDRPTVSTNGSFVSPPKNNLNSTKIPFIPGCDIAVPDWVLEDYIKWKESISQEEFAKTKAFWATDTRIGVVLEKSNKEKNDFYEDYSKGEVVKVFWFGRDMGQTWQDGNPWGEPQNYSYHHVRNLRDIENDGLAEKKLYPCNFNMMPEKIK